MRRPRCEVHGCKELAVSFAVRRCQRHEYEHVMRQQRAEAPANVTPVSAAAAKRGSR